MAERGWNLEVYGLKELEKIMTETLPNKVNRRVLLSAIRISAQPMKQTAKNIVVKRSGALAESIGLKTISNRGGNKYFASVALAPMSGNLAAWAKYKTYYSGKHPGGDILSGKISARSARIARIRHGHLVEFGFRHRSGKQIPARPFLRPAFDIEANGFVRIFRDNLAKRILAAAKKIYGKNEAMLRLKR